MLARGALGDVAHAPLWTDAPADSVAFAKRCRDAWGLMRDALLAAGAEDAAKEARAESVALFRALCAWRAERARRAVASDASAAFVLQCGLRVLLLDRAQKVCPARAHARRDVDFELCVCVRALRFRAKSAPTWRLR